MSPVEIVEDEILKALERHVTFDREVVIVLPWGDLARIRGNRLLAFGVAVRFVAEGLVDLREDVPTCH